jgi:hypothetical protein
MEHFESGNIEQDISLWLDRERKIKELFGNDIVNDKIFLKEKLRHFESISDKHKLYPEKNDRIMLILLKRDISILEQKVYPNNLVRLLSNAARRVMNYLEQRKAAKESLHQSLTFNPKMIDSNSNKLENRYTKEENQQRIGIKHSQIQQNPFEKINKQSQVDKNEIENEIDGPKQSLKGSRQSDNQNNDDLNVNAERKKQANRQKNKIH